MTFLYKTLHSFFICWLSAFALMAQSAQPETCDGNCCTEDISPAGITNAHIHDKGDWMFSYIYMHTAGNSILSGGSRISSADVYNQYIMSPESMRMDMHMLMAMYGLTGRLNIMAMLQYNTMGMRMSMPAASPMHMPGMNDATMPSQMDMQSSGLGDATLSLMYQLCKGEQHTVIAGAGIGLPLGSIHQSGDAGTMYENQHLTYAMQPGSGTVSLLPSLTYIRTGALTFGAQASGIVRLGYNVLGYRQGNGLSVNSWLAFKVLPWLSGSLRIQDNITGAIKGSDPALFSGYEPSADTRNYGGQCALLFAGANFYCHKSIFSSSRIGAEYGIPLYQNLNGIQTGTKSALYATLAISF